MNLAVIARALRPQPTGRGLLAAEFIGAIQRVRPDIDVHVFSGAAPDLPGISWHRAEAGGFLSDLWHLSHGTARTLRRLRPDALWCATHLLPSGLDNDLGTVATVLDVVWRDHPDTMTRRNRWAARWGERGLTRADRVMCISEFTRDRLVHYRPDLRSRARVVRCAPASTLMRSRLCDPVQARPVVANVGTLEPRKNMAVVIEAMRALPDCDLVQCGGRGWKVSSLREEAQRLPNVHLQGYASEDIVHCLYRRATVGVFPSLYEGFHLPPLEAMALGCPVIASDIPVHREVLGDAALYVRPSDVSAWTGAIRRVIENPTERSRLAEAGRAQAARYSWDSAARDLLAVIEEVVDGRKASPQPY